MATADQGDRKGKRKAAADVRDGSDRTKQDGGDSVGQRVVDVMQFANARAQEILLLEKALAERRSNRRAFQTLPRHLRRRAMSHNAHRLPSRLRQAAQKENELTQPPQHDTRRKKRRPRRMVTEHLARKARHVWLETHLWHAKRMHMKTIWGYRLAESPTFRGARAAFRSAAHECVVHDASYISCLELRGSQSGIAALLKSFTDPGQIPVDSSNYIGGTRQATTVLHRPNQFPFGALAPAHVQWRPVHQDSAAAGPSQAPQRQAWVWVHCAAFRDVLSLMEREAAVVAQNDGSDQVTVHDLSSQLLRFELWGPRAHETLCAIFGLVGADSDVGNPETEAKKQVFEALRGLRSTASLHEGCILSLHVRDPRLKFPHGPNSAARGRKLKAPAASGGIGQVDDVLAMHPKWSPALAQSVLWDEEARRTMRDDAVPTHKLNKHRQKELLGGPAPAVSAGVNPHVMLVQHPSLLRRGLGSGWDIVLPAGWGMAVWTALQYAGARAIGYNERHMLLREQGVPTFPDDFIDTPAYALLQSARGVKCAHQYVRTPVAKRTNYEKLETAVPFIPQWGQLMDDVEVLVTPFQPGSVVEMNTVKPSVEGHVDGHITPPPHVRPFVATVPDDIHLHNLFNTELTRASIAVLSDLEARLNTVLATGLQPLSLPSPQFAVLRGCSAMEVYERLERVCVNLAPHIDDDVLSKTMGKDAVVTTATGWRWQSDIFKCSATAAWHITVGTRLSEQVLRKSLCRVKLTMVGRGEPHLGSALCLPMPEDYASYRSNHQWGGPVFDPDDKLKGRRTIGFVSSGSFSFVRGRGDGIAFVSVVGLTAMYLQELKIGKWKDEGFVLIRNPGTPQYRVAFIEIMP